MKLEKHLLPLPDHPAIVIEPPVRRSVYGRNIFCARVTCPHCGREQWYPRAVLRSLASRATYTGACKPCWGKNRDRAPIRKIRNKEGRVVLARTGYVAIYKSIVEPADLWMFDRMRNKASYVLEHRWIMARHLGRPLASYENVDHRDGDRSNNVLSNLRLYLKGKQQPGSCPGYGTYYHEWQLALARIRDLESRLAAA
jgi:hypothetical protein